MEQAPLARHIRLRRNQLGLTQQELAIKAGVNLSTVQDYERNKQRGERRGGTHVKLARALEWPDDALIRLADGLSPDQLVSTPPNPDPTGLGSMVDPGFNDRIDRLLTGVERVTTKVDNLDIEVSTLSRTQGLLGTRVGQVEREVAELAARFDRFERQAAS